MHSPPCPLFSQVRCCVNPSVERSSLSPLTIMHLNEQDAVIVAAQHAAMAAQENQPNWKSGLDPAAMPWAMTPALYTLATAEALMSQALAKGDNVPDVALVCVWLCFADCVCVFPLPCSIGSD